MTNKNRILTLLDDETTKLLKEKANKEGRSVSNLIAFLIRQYLKHEHEHRTEGK